MVPYETVERRRHKTRKTLGFFAGVLLFLLGFSSSSFGERDGPPYFMVEQDWKAIMKNDANCDSCVRLSRVKVLGMDVKKTTASVSIEVVGDWVGFGGCHRASGPCSGFSASGGIGQVVHKTLRYRKLDAGWKMVTSFKKSRTGGGHRSKKSGSSGKE